MSIDPSRKNSEPLLIDGISYIPSSVLLPEIPKVSFKSNRSFAVLDSRGESPRVYNQSSEMGIYSCDTRHLSIWETTINGTAPIPLSSELRYGGNTLVFSMTPGDLPRLDGPGRIPRDSFLVRRILSWDQDCLFELWMIRNFTPHPQLIQLEQWAGSRFEDIFEVRGFPRLKRGHMLTPLEHREEKRSQTVLQYEGLDSQVRATWIERAFPTEKIRLSPDLSGSFCRMLVPPKGESLLRTAIGFSAPPPTQYKGTTFVDISVPDAMRRSKEEQSNHPLFSSLKIETDNAIINRGIQNATLDLQMLVTKETTGQSYPYAGVPWFSAPFGRDGLITAYQMLPWHPELARGVLDYVFERLGTKVDDFTDEEPGKVFHELRLGEMTRTREVPFIPYYGSVDATPLALILLHEYMCWTRDLTRLRKWWPSALSALQWMDQWGDWDGDGFIEYAKRSSTGLINQGWKDSNDSVMHEDGTLAHAPIRLCEVQAYAFRAKMAMSELARLQGELTMAESLRAAALRLRAEFIEKFWDADGQYIYLALDGGGRPCKVRSSNMGLCLWGRIMPDELARPLARELLSDAIFNGYGIRTLADTERAYNPLSYHNGSVWPHDCSMILEGLRDYGFTAELEKLAEGLCGVLEAGPDFRLPELFCGFRRRGDEPPVPYLVACKPQAWAAGSVFLLLKSILGLRTTLDSDELVLRSPLLTGRLGRICMKGLRIRDAVIDLTVTRSGPMVHHEVVQRSGSVRVLIVKS